MRVLALVAALLLSATFVVLAEPQHALACSVSPDFDPVASSDAIVEGRFLGYEVLANEGQNSSTIPIRLTMDVSRVFKGDVQAEGFSIVDESSLWLNTPKLRWSGSGGNCGTFNEDPTGSYWILGLSTRDDGNFSPSGPLVFFRGDGPSGQTYGDAVARITSQLDSASLPPTGTGGGAETGVNRVPLLAIVSLSALGALSLGAFTLRSRRHPA